MSFRFTISQLGVVLGKSPVTIRNWERKGLVTLPRVGNSRSLDIREVMAVAQTAQTAGRIDQDRLLTINDALGYLEELERS